MASNSRPTQVGPANEPSPGTHNEAARQVAALCYRTCADGSTEVLIITTRETKRWAIPKGWPIKGKSSHEAAEQEAWEEAGVKGKVEKAVFGHYTYLKRLPNVIVPSAVEVHLLEVDRIAKKFPEKGQRNFKWLPAGEAAEMVDEPDLAALIHRFGERPPKLKKQA